MKFPNLFKKGRKTMNDQATPAAAPAAAETAPAQGGPAQAKVLAAASLGEPDHPAPKKLRTELVESYRKQLAALEADVSALIHRIDGTAVEAGELAHELLDEAKDSLHHLVASVESHLAAVTPAPETKAAE